MAYISGIQIPGSQEKYDIKAKTLSGLTADVSELNYVDGVTSPIQTQIDGKTKIAVSGTAPEDTVFWLDTSEPGYDPSAISTAINEHNTSSASHPDKVSNSMIGAANGIAELDASGKVPTSQLPSFVDDVIEGYYHEGQFYHDAEHTQLITPESGKIYVDLATNKTYRWSGSIYVEISASLTLGETSTTAYRGDRGKIAYDHSVHIGDVAPEDDSIVVWMDTSAMGYNPSDLTTLITEHNQNSQAHPAIPRVSANPSVTSESAKLQSISIGSTDYKLAGGNGIVVSDTPPTDPDITAWMDTAEAGYNPTDMQEIMRTHNADANAHPSKQDNLNLSVVNGQICITYETT